MAVGVNNLEMSLICMVFSTGVYLEDSAFWVTNNHKDRWSAWSDMGDGMCVCVFAGTLFIRQHFCFNDKRSHIHLPGLIFFNRATWLWLICCKYHANIFSKMLWHPVSSVPINSYSWRSEVANVLQSQKVRTPKPHVAFRLKGSMVNQVHPSPTSPSAI